MKPTIPLQKIEKKTGRELKRYSLCLSWPSPRFFPSDNTTLQGFTFHYAIIIAAHRNNSICTRPNTEKMTHGNGNRTRYHLTTRTRDSKTAF